MNSFKSVIKKAALIGTISVSMAAIGVGAFAKGQGSGPGKWSIGDSVDIYEVPVTILDRSLKLTDDQKTRIGHIEKKFRDDDRKLRSAHGTQPPVLAEEINPKHKATDGIIAVLTRDQKTALPGLLNDLGALNYAGIPYAALPELALSNNVKAKIIKASNEVLKHVVAKNAKGFPFLLELWDGMKTANKAGHALLTRHQRAILRRYPEASISGGASGPPPVVYGGVAPLAPPVAP